MVISVYNHKGGTGKTTTTINIGMALKNLGYSILLVDLDPQANMTYSLGVERNVISDIALSSDNVVVTSEGLEIIPNFTSPQFLVDYEYPSITALADELGGFFSEYDYVLIDCPPAMNMTVVNSLLASDAVLIPAIMDPLSLEALRQVLDAIENLMDQYDHSLSFTGVLPVMVDSRRQLTHEVKQYIDENINVTVFDNKIRMNVKIAESPSYGQSVVSYASNSNGALDYKAAANELVNKLNN